MPVIERIQRGLFSLDKDGYEPFEVELIGDDWNELHIEMEAGPGPGTEGWPDSVCGLPFRKVSFGKSAVVARRRGTATRASFLI